MCMTLYLFTDNIVQEVEFNTNSLELHIEASKEEAIRAWKIPRKNVYYIGSFQGCGCGWALTVDEDNLDDEERAGIRRDREELLRLLNGANSTGVCSDRERLLQLLADTDSAGVRSDRDNLLQLLNGTDFAGARLVMCWEGDQGADLRGRKTIDAATLCNPRFELEELVEYQLA